MTMKKQFSARQKWMGFLSRQLFFSELPTTISLSLELNWIFMTVLKLSGLLQFLIDLTTSTTAKLGLRIEKFQMGNCNSFGWNPAA